MKRLIAILLVVATLMPLTMAFAAEYNLGDRILTKGMTGTDVKQAQQRLIHYLYMEGKANSTFNNAMLAAVREFQKRNDLKVNGIIDAGTAKKLKSTTARYADNPLAPDYVLKPGDKGEAVKVLQRHLRATYYYKGSITGKYDVYTTNAVKNFQRSAGLTVDGKAGKNTKTLLYNRKAAIFNGGLPLRDLSQGDRGYDVYAIQQKLYNLNYLASAPTGVYNAATTAAMKKFESKNGLNQTGKFTATTRRYLYPSLVDARIEQNWRAKDTKDDKYVPRTLKLYSKGDDVAAAQMKLKAAGYLLDKADGVFGQSTKKAVIAVQNDYNLDPDGVIGPATWAVIRTFNVQNADPKTVDVTRTGTVAPKLLRAGDRNSNVTLLQQYLIKLGYLPLGEDDGIFGARTTKAVKKFQKAHNLVADGIVGTKTLVALHEALGIQWIVK
ncbi:MAG: peptidoglycan-binding protein [Clostridia bacterium]|nr:peptidoglycan-binding protein [Clostridia bacterium]